MASAKIIFICIFVMATIACTNDSSDHPGSEQQRLSQLKTIDSLIRNENFSVEVAKTIDSNYQAQAGLKSTPFISEKEKAESVNKTIVEEKVATNLSGFYALECGIGLLCERSKKKPTEILTEIVSGKLDSSSIDILNRFANATWKAAQPFRDIKRITRATFTVFNFLPPDEVRKDFDQIRSAASKLLFSLQDLNHADIGQQMERIRSLLQNEKYAYEMAVFLDSSYYSNNSKPIMEFLTPADTALIKKPAMDMKVAANVAGLYALECGIVYLSTQKKQLPSVLLKELLNDSINREDKMLLARFANATWKSGQPFRGLNRILRETFTPFFFLSEKDIEKDILQVKTAAAAILKELDR